MKAHPPTGGTTGRSRAFTRNAARAALQRNTSGRLGLGYIARPRLALFIYSATAQLVGGRSIGNRQCGAVPHCALNTHTERSRCNTQHATCELRHYSRLQRATGNGQNRARRNGRVATSTRRCELQRAACPGYYVVSSTGAGGAVCVPQRHAASRRSRAAARVEPPRTHRPTALQPTALQTTDSNRPSIKSRRAGGGATRTVASSTRHGGAVAQRVLPIALSESPHPTHPCAALSAMPLYRRSFLRRGDTAAHRCFRCERVALPLPVGSGAAAEGLTFSLHVLHVVLLFAASRCHAPRMRLGASHTCMRHRVATWQLPVHTWHVACGCGAADGGGRARGGRPFAAQR